MWLWAIAGPLALGIGGTSITGVILSVKNDYRRKVARRKLHVPRVTS